MLAYLRETENSKRSPERDRYALKQLYPFFTERELATLTAQDIRAYIASRREWGWEILNPAQGRRLQEPEGRMRWLTQAEAAALIRVAATEPQAPHLPDFIQLALNTGMRSGELFGLEWQRVDLNGHGLIFLEGQHILVTPPFLGSQQRRWKAL